MTKRPIRVGLVLYRDNLDVGGALRVAELLANSFDRKQVEPAMFFAYGSDGPVAAQASFPCFYLGAKGSADFRSWPKARKAVQQFEPDVMHFHQPAVWLQAALAGTGITKIYHEHGPVVPKELSSKQKAVYRMIPRMVQGQICITDEMRDMLVEQQFAVAERTWTVYNAIETSRFENLPSKQEARRMLGLPEDALIAGMVCRLAWWKGCVEAVDVVADAGANWHLLLCGDGPMKQSVIQAARERGIEDKVHFVGMRDDVAPVYAAMDAYLFMSRYEPFGLVMAEAMAAGVPVFGLAGDGGYRDPRNPLITPENSVFVDRKSANAERELAAQLAEFERNRAPFDEVAARGQQWVRDRFDISIQTRSLENVYQQVLA